MEPLRPGSPILGTFPYNSVNLAPVDLIFCMVRYVQYLAMYNKFNSGTVASCTLVVHSMSMVSLKMVEDATTGGLIKWPLTLMYN